MKFLTTYLLSVSNVANRMTGSVAGQIFPNERVIFFPTSASLLPSSSSSITSSPLPDTSTTNKSCNNSALLWKVPIHGWIFQPKVDSKKRAAFRSLLRRALQVKPLSQEDSILKQRIHAFVVDNEPLRSPTITLAGQEYTMLPSAKNGHFHTTLTLSLSSKQLKDFPINDNDHQSSSSSSSIKILTYFASSSDGEKKFEGKVYLVPPRGITVVSDIDDTIKITNVVRKREMLRNTFLKEFKVVPGMPELYRKWNSEEKPDDDPNWNVHWHLLSASMYQLYEDLETFRKASGFPPATYSLKTVRPKKAAQTLRTLLEDPRAHKRKALIRLLETYPDRHFVLVGDTGEKDPAIYASIYQQYPHQILAIYLRYVSKGPLDNVSMRADFSRNEFQVPKHKWKVFRDPSELMNVNLTDLWKEQVNEHEKQ